MTNCAQQLTVGQAQGPSQMKAWIVPAPAWEGAPWEHVAWEDMEWATWPEPSSHGSTWPGLHIYSDIDGALEAWTQPWVERVTWHWVALVAWIWEHEHASPVALRVECRLGGVASDWRR